MANGDGGRKGPSEHFGEHQLLRNDELGHLACKAERAAERDAALGLLFRRLWPDTVRWCRGYGARDDAQAQDAAMNAWVNAGRGKCSYSRSKGSYEQWLRVITRNATFDVVRQERKHPTAPLGDDLATGATAEGPATDDLPGAEYEGPDEDCGYAVWAIHRAFRALMEKFPNYGEVIKLTSLGLSDGKIAHRQHVARGTVGGRRSRGRDFIADNLAEHGCVLVDPENVPVARAAGVLPLCVEPMGFPLTFCEFSPFSGVFVVRGGEPKEASLVCDAFHEKVWLYRPDSFCVVGRNEDVGRGDVVFSLWGLRVVRR